MIRRKRPSTQASSFSSAPPPAQRYLAPQNYLRTPSPEADYRPENRPQEVGYWGHKSSDTVTVGLSSSDCDTDDEVMSLDDTRASSPHSSGLRSPRLINAPRSSFHSQPQPQQQQQQQQRQPQQQHRPTLPDVLSNTAPPPWTLSAFTAYLSQNHCLENLEFTLDAERYKANYDEIAGRATATGAVPSAEEVEHLHMLWQRILDAYIISDCPREINIPSLVRQRLLAVSDLAGPPNPSVLDDAIRIVYNLMEESVLLSFLNDTAPSQVSTSHTPRDRSAAPSDSRRRRGGSDSSSTFESNKSSISVRSFSRRRASPAASLEAVAPPPATTTGTSGISAHTAPSSTVTSPVAVASAGPFHRHHHHYSASLDASSRPSGPSLQPQGYGRQVAGSHSGSSMTATARHYMSSHEDVMILDDAGSVAMGVGMGGVGGGSRMSVNMATGGAAGMRGEEEPMTPPSTPPASEFGGSSPRSRVMGEAGAWKKMLGWKRRE